MKHSPLFAMEAQISSLTTVYRNEYVLVATRVSHVII